MAKINDKFIIELAEVIKGYGNDPDIEDPFRLSEFYRFYELPNIAVSRENFEKMRPAEQKKGNWIYNDEAYAGGNPYGHYECDQCGEYVPHKTNFCPNCGTKMEK